MHNISFQRFLFLRLLPKPARRLLQILYGVQSRECENYNAFRYVTDLLRRYKDYRRAFEKQAGQDYHHNASRERDVSFLARFRLQRSVNIFPVCWILRVSIRRKKAGVSFNQYWKKHLVGNRLVYGGHRIHVSLEIVGHRHNDGIFIAFLKFRIDLGDAI